MDKVDFCAEVTLNVQTIRSIRVPTGTGKPGKWEGISSEGKVREF